MGKGEGDPRNGEGDPEEVEGEGLVLPLGDGGVFVPGGGGGGEGVELATHEPSPLQTCPDWQTCMCRATRIIDVTPITITISEVLLQ